MAYDDCISHQRNLTAAITTLNHLHMLVRGTASLAQLAQTRQYGEAALLLQGLLEVLNHFQPYQNIPQIRELSDQVRCCQSVFTTGPDNMTLCV